MKRLNAFIKMIVTSCRKNLLRLLEDFEVSLWGTSGRCDILEGVFIQFTSNMFLRMCSAEKKIKLGILNGLGLIIDILIFKNFR